MLKKDNRLAHTKDIRLVYSHGRSFFNQNLIIKFIPKLGKVRCTVVVSTKVAKQAVIRNRLKRQAREVLRKQLPYLPHGNYVVTIKPPAKNLENAFFRQILTEQILKISQSKRNYSKKI